MRNLRKTGSFRIRPACGAGRKQPRYTTQEEESQPFFARLNSGNPFVEPVTTGRTVTLPRRVLPVCFLRTDCGIMFHRPCGNELRIALLCFVLATINLGLIFLFNL